MIANNAACSPPRYLFLVSFLSNRCSTRVRHFIQLNYRVLYCFKAEQLDENPAK